MFYKTQIKEFNLDKSKLTRKKLKIYEMDTKPLTPLEIVYLFISYILLLLWALIILFPAISLIVASINVFNSKFVAVVPFQFGMDNFSYLVNGDRSYYGSWYLNTILIAGATMIITIIFVTLNGYAYSRFKFKGSKHSLGVVMLIQMIPATASLISLYIIVTMGKKIGFDPRIMLIIIYSGTAIAGNTFIFKGYIDSISTELDDSAKIDGLGNWKLFLKILVPVTKPMIAIIALWSFLTPFGDVILPKFVIFDLKQTTLPVGLDSFLNTDLKNINAGAYSAGAILATIPPFILFMYLQRFIVGGLSSGAMKG